MRLWVHPPAGYSDLSSDLALARDVRAAGEGVPGHPLLGLLGRSTAPDHPGRLAGPGPAELADTVRPYTHDVISAFARQGTPVDLVSVGNEIRNGMLWPTGQIDWTADTGWDNLVTLLKAGVAGARAANRPGTSCA